jgi:CheY-like chemotaxis protein
MANVLLVEDDANLLQALGTLLVHEGHQVRRAENGTEALNATSVEAPDIIVTDVMMPGMGWHSVGARIESNAVTCPFL